MMGSFMGRGNQYIQLVKVLYCKLPTISKQPPIFPHKVWGLNHGPQTWELRVLPQHHRGFYTRSIKQRARSKEDLSNELPLHVPSPT